jgi:hypothetical protein
MYFYSRIVQEFIFDIKLLVIFSIGLLWYLNTSAIQYASDLEIGKVWETATSEAYGHSLDEFGMLGDDGLFIQWATPKQIGKSCSHYSKCNFVRLASMMPCSKGYTINIELLDAFDKTLWKETLPPVIVQVGSITALEVDYRKVPRKGAILLTGASCSKKFPSI